jgi:hypothetical protein
LGGLLYITALSAQPIIGFQPAANHFRLDEAQLCVHPQEEQLVQMAARFLQQDLQAVTDYKAPITTALPKKAKTLILMGTPEQSPWIRELLDKKIITWPAEERKWESYLIQTVTKPFPGVDQAIVVAGNDRRGLAYGVFELSKQMGVSPWYWWADVPIQTHTAIYIRSNARIEDAPKVKYRGIFINDEAPALSGWTREKFGGFNHRFYAKVFELILRLKGNYIWPAMWGNAFYDDDSLNRSVAEEYGIVIGTSHHEPLMRAHAEWRKYGEGPWDYNQNQARLREFWKGGMERASNEKIVTVGMRGDGDEPMSRETATSLLEKIVTDQRNIIEAVTGKSASATPQLWALYKEVQDYYDKGMRVPDDVTLLIADDNWGNIRRVADPKAPARAGGYGIYYHFDYVGGPRNYNWINTNPLPRIWEQMHLAWEFDMKQIWIVNVGDIKPMEFPISFFLDYAWDPEAIDANDIMPWSVDWASRQLGAKHAEEAASLLSLYAKYNSRRKPELLDARTYSFNYGEWTRVVNEYQQLLKRANSLKEKLPANQQDAYFQLILHPIWASANLYEMYYEVALNQRAYERGSADANRHADRVKQLYIQDSLITLAYHQLGNGKWNHMMSQTHIGYTYWQQPPVQRMPALKYLSPDSVRTQPVVEDQAERRAAIPADVKGNVYFESSHRGVSIEADHYTRLVNANGIEWKLLPDHGRTGSAITAFPVTAPVQEPGKASAHVAYDIYTFSEGEFSIHAYFSPTLNLHNQPEGLQYAISVDDEEPQILSINKEDKNTGTGIWNKWVAENIIIKTTRHQITKPGKHTVRFWVVDPAVVLQKLVLDFGNNQPSYLGPPETIHQTKKTTK